MAGFQNRRPGEQRKNHAGRARVSRLSLSLRRFAAVMGKETIQRLRDRRTLALILFMPLIQLVLFAYAVDLTADHLPTVVADLSLDEQSRAFIDALSVSGYFDIASYEQSEMEVIRAIDQGRAQAGIVIPPDLDASIARGDAQILVILDGSDSFSVQSGYSAATTIAQARSLKLVAEQVERMGGQLITSPITSSSRVLYNPNLNDLVFVMPGLIAMLLQVLAVNTTAQSVVREYELGTIEQILITPIRPIELVIGKLIPNVFLGLVDQLAVVLLGILWFGVPFRGSGWLFAWLSLLFVVSGIGLGLLISTIAQTQKQAQQLTSLLMMLSQLLTGFIYPRGPMPPLVKMIGNLIPLTYFIRIARGIFTKGIGIAFLWQDVIALVVYGGVVMVLAAVTFKKRLD
jgi:ABC-2 type transport system permease protein